MDLKKSNFYARGLYNESKSNLKFILIKIPFFILRLKLQSVLERNNSNNRKIICYKSLLTILS
jgi:hypothetical protein